ncbi:hypothetical protein WN51_11387 [Melipona quadrifasciata]|uniref:Uncharacterized protein n=1 Tax=Melipona quadrifasciata TaxID=166423 RepID=A0A0M9A969_9HYME|nr:hypothetical protein WN51_11387 [Melipona quadrifasciata]
MTDYGRRRNPVDRSSATEETERLKIIVADRNDKVAEGINVREDEFRRDRFDLPGRGERNEKRATSLPSAALVEEREKARAKGRKRARNVRIRLYGRGRTGERREGILNLFAPNAVHFWRSVTDCRNERVYTNYARTARKVEKRNVFTANRSRFDRKRMKQLSTGERKAYLIVRGWDLQDARGVEVATYADLYGERNTARSPPLYSYANKLRE